MQELNVSLSADSPDRPRLPNSPRLVLGIETSCDETAAALVDEHGVVRSSVVSSQVPIHVRYGGVVPELASRNHLVAIRPVIEEALATAGVELDQVAAIAVTAGPGLAGCLLVGMQVAKAIAFARGLPLVLVDHIQAHVWAPYLSDGDLADAAGGAKSLTYPYVALAVSGGHTSILRVDGPGRATTLGATLDDAAGEAFDKIAKLMGLPYPGGIYIDQLSETGNAEAYELPRPLMNKGLDFSFSGLKTAARLVWEKASTVPGADVERVRADLAASVQAAIVEVLVDKSLRACREFGIAQLVAAGGVACNRGLRKRLVEKAARQKIRVRIAPARYCSDNAAMIAGLGGALLAEGASLSGAALLGADIYVTSRKRAS